ncbi:putative bifunctional diguanylate cyclase/phosphodiesterase [Mongoliimonas terrestris]|uniref:putative bifunctional diguanylate cyclase/phosphodiesterase n=1 Tax=Mongoliimonas terrestris TaxID=1709001 RepID=UPI0009497B4D|nr:bifunctional diguanylate cyclase/phosphodiesterase [Mongoliimonas terrestris]
MQPAPLPDDRAAPPLPSRDDLAAAFRRLGFPAALVDSNGDVRLASEAYDPLHAGPADRVPIGADLVLVMPHGADARADRQDALTGLPDRRVLGEALAADLRAGLPFAFLLVDLDRFKSVNDTLGHPVGDRLLLRVVDRLRKVIGPHDLLARLGGDEFAVVHRSADPAVTAEALGARLVDLVGRAVIIGEHLITVGASVGIVLPAPDDDADRLLQAADLALYQAKEDGRGRYRLFDPAMDARAKARRDLETELRRALALRQFAVHYQPQVALGSGTLTGFEALVRWNHPERGLVPPAAFIPVAEETGLIVGLGEWVLRTACMDAAAWPGDLKVAVNLSPMQFDGPGLPAVVASALARSGLLPERLELEITESVLLADTSATLATLGQLKALGVRIAMDDFGTGYSSLSYLRAFPFDKVKIDRSFVADMEVNADSAAIVRAVLTLGASLGMSTTAEGVETGSQLALLRAEGCDDAQGYFLSRPVPAADVAATIARLAVPAADAAPLDSVATTPAAPSA